MTKVEKYPKDFQEFLAQFKGEDDCWDYIFNVRWLEGFSCPKCDSKQYLDNKETVDTLYFLWASSINNCRYNISRDEKTFVVMVSHNVVGCSSEDWSKCIQSNGFYGIRVIRNGMDMVTKVTQGNGTNWKGQINWRC